jgi:hypothetical protein
MPIRALDSNGRRRHDFISFFIIHRDMSRAERTVTAMDEYSDN